jgi:hypothetical protein
MMRRSRAALAGCVAPLDDVDALTSAALILNWPAPRSRQLWGMSTCNTRLKGWGQIINCHARNRSPMNAWLWLTV